MSNKSFFAKIEEKILMSTKPDYMDSKEKVDEFIREKSMSKDKIPNGIFKSRDFNGMDVFTFGDENDSIHGGAYINEINYQHLLYCFKLSRKLGAYVVAPVYLLDPNHNAMECIDALEGVI